MGKPTGFMEFTRETPTRRPVAERVHDWLEVYEDFPAETAARRRRRAAWTAASRSATRAARSGNIIPDWNDLVYRDQWREAIDRLHATNNFPEFTGRLCPAPCEAACVLGINDDPVTIKQVELSIIERAFDEGWIEPEPPEMQDRQDGRGRRLGPGGPGRRAAAGARRPRGHGLRARRPHRRAAALRHPRLQDGEALPRPPPASRWRRRASSSEPSVNVGVDIDGARAAEAVRRRLPVRRRDARRATSRCPGASSKGVHFAMEFLPLQNKRNAGDEIPRRAFISAKGKRVIILGGGDTGADCLGTVHRQGAKRSSSIEIAAAAAATTAPTDNPWPTWPNIYRVSSAHEEGGVREYAS